MPIIFTLHLGGFRKYLSATIGKLNKCTVRPLEGVEGGYDALSAPDVI